MSKAMIAVDKSGSYRVYVTVTTDLVQEAVSIHDTTPVASAALGRVLTAAGLMGIMLKSDEDKLTVNFKGNGQARQILATAHGDGTVKGYIANPYVDLPLKENGKQNIILLGGSNSVMVNGLQKGIREGIAKLNERKDEKGQLAFYSFTLGATNSIQNLYRLIKHKILSKNAKLIITTNPLLTSNLQKKCVGLIKS